MQHYFETDKNLAFSVKVQTGPTLGVFTKGSILVVNSDRPSGEVNGIDYLKPQKSKEGNNNGRVIHGEGPTRPKSR